MPTNPSWKKEMKRIKGKESVIKVAALQFQIRVADKAHNMNKMEEYIEKAVAHEAKFLVLPELANSGYVFNNRSEANNTAETIPDGPSMSMLLNKAREKKIYICSGLLEKDGNRLFNSAVLIGPEGFIGKYRKLHLWNEGKLWWDYGNLGLPVFHLPFGRVGMLICYDIWFPETTRMLKLQGADLILSPTNWDVDPKIVTEDNLISPEVACIMAHVNSVFIVSADTCGYQRDIFFHGNSQIAGPLGKIARGSIKGEEIITAEINITDARKTQWTEYNDILMDRRTDVYDVILKFIDTPDR
jgi:predicted amidohydrolase